jgi:hypothetical protein
MNDLNAAEQILVDAQLAFNWHPSRPMPEGYRILCHAQKHINLQRPNYGRA